MRLSLEEWDNLPNYEKRDRLAYDHWRQNVIQNMLDGLIEGGTTSDGKISINTAAYVALQLGKLT